jgi:hypothetical protein
MLPISSDFSNALEILFCLTIFTHFVGAGPLECLFFKPQCKKVDGKLRQQGVVIGGPMTTPDRCK